MLLFRLGATFPGIPPSWARPLPYCLLCTITFPYLLVKHTLVRQTELCGQTMKRQQFVLVTEKPVLGLVCSFSALCQTVFLYLSVLPPNTTPSLCPYPLFLFLFFLPLGPVCTG